MQLDRVKQLLAIMSHNNRYYVMFKEGKILRWNARQIHETKDYCTMTTTLWKRVGLKNNPVGVDDKPIPVGSTYYFQTEEQALIAAQQYVDKLSEKIAL